jgi:hypothetical protein
MFDTKVLSVVRCWENGAILSGDNLEASWMLDFFPVRKILPFKRSKIPVYVDRFLRLLIDSLHSRKVKPEVDFNMA